MKAIICELCGSNELIKEDEYFRCAHCNTLYTLEAARGLLQDKPKTVNGIPTVESLAKRGKDYLREGEVDKALEYASRILDIDPDNEDGVLLERFANGTIDENNVGIRILPSLLSKPQTMTLKIDGVETYRFKFTPGTTRRDFAIRVPIGCHRLSFSDGDPGAYVQIHNRYSRYAVIVKMWFGSARVDSLFRDCPDDEYSPAYVGAGADYSDFISVDGRGHYMREFAETYKDYPAQFQKQWREFLFEEWEREAFEQAEAEDDL